MKDNRMDGLREVTWSFLKLGATAFGGPAAHIGMFRQEFVGRRRWITDAEFLDLLGATNLIPGPNSTEMAIHIGFLRAGWAGLAAGGLAFTLPAVIIVLGLSWLYVQYGATPQVGWLLYGVKPVVIAIILQALWGLGRKALKDTYTVLLALAMLGLYFGGVNEILLLLAGGLLTMLVRNWSRLHQAGPGGAALLIPPALGLVAGVTAFSLPVLFLVFLKIGAILYGSGYVLIAFLRADLVTRLGWLTEQQLIDAIAIGQITPGPLFTSATFIGYILGGFPGAILATIGIFLPSYIFVAISNPFIPRLRRSPWAGSLLDGVIIASLSLMAAVSFQLGTASLTDLPAILIFLVSVFLLFRYKVNSTWLILGGAVCGWLTALVR